MSNSLTEGERGKEMEMYIDHDKTIAHVAPSDDVLVRRALEHPSAG